MMKGDFLMNILIIGNGFDLAHGLPTTYKDFLDYITTYGNYIKNLNVGLNENNQLKGLKGNIYKFLKHIIGIHNSKKNVFDEFQRMIMDNSWVNYFSEIDRELCRLGKVGWIDFESEISKVVQEFEDIRNILLQNKDQKDFDFGEYKRQVLFDFYINKKQPQSMEDVYNIRQNMINDLNRLIRALEIYLSDFVNNIEVEQRLPDIIDLQIDKVLSFNYTNTYERLYGKDNPDIEYDYIHGKADISHNLLNCNMVLGIDEYLSETERDENVDFIQFKKFYQRIYKKTGCKYFEWQINNKEQTKFFKGEQDMYWNNVYILGHSLDFTDKDILESIITMENTKSIIFHHDQNALGKQIANLVKVIRQKNLISMVQGSDPSIILQQQQEAKNVEVEKKKE